MYMHVYACICMYIAVSNIHALHQQPGSLYMYVYVCICMYTYVYDVFACICMFMMYMIVFCMYNACIS